MDWILILLVVALVVIAGLLVAGQLRSMMLKRRFGPEYDRVLEAEGDKRKAEAALRERAKRRGALDIKDVSPDVRDRYTAQLRDAQWGFVDDPVQAVGEAGALVQEVMHVRGYPVDGLEARMEMLTVDYPGLAERYRWAYGVQYRGQEAGETSLDDLRRAFQHYRALLHALVDAEDAAAKEPAL